MRQASLLTTTALLMVPGWALGAEIKADSSVTAATVYPMGATIQRAAEFDMEAGRHTVLISDLPLGVNEDSLRLEGEGAFKIIAIDRRSADRAALEKRLASEREKIQEAIRQAEDEREYAQNAVSAAEAQQEFIHAMIQAQTDARAREQQGAARVMAGEWPQLWGFTREGMKQALDAAVTARAEIRAVERKIAALQAQLNDVGRDGQGGESVVAVDVAAEAPVAGGKLVLKYQTDAAGWMPVYDARLTTGEAPEVELVRRASVAQSTGEPWKGVAVTLSTARPSGRAAPLDPWVQRATLRTAAEIRAEEERRIAARNEAAMARARLAAAAPEMEMGQDQARMIKGEGFGGAMAMAAPAPAPIIAPPPASAPAEQAFASALKQGETLNFVLSEPADIDGAGTRRELLIGSEKHKPKVDLRATPRIEATAYLTASFINEGDAPILPGAASLYRDGVYVGKAELKRVAPGEEAELPFGASDALKIEHRVVDVKADREEVFQLEKTLKRRFETKIENLTDKPQILRLQDSMPYSEHEKLKITLVSDLKPTETDVKGQRGRLMWKIELAPKEKKTLAFGYDAVWPAGDQANVP